MSVEIDPEEVLSDPQLVRSLIGDLDFEVSFSGFKSSEGDGRTAADIEREQEERSRGTE